jgi:hypothetical protein
VGKTTGEAVPRGSSQRGAGTASGGWRREGKT